MKELFLLFCLCLLSCNHNYPKETETGAKSWKRYQFSVPNSSGFLSAFDAVKDPQGKWHVALIMRVSDEDSRSSTELMYFTNKTGTWRKRVLKSSPGLFQLVRGGNNANNFLRILIDAQNGPQLFYTTSDFRLMHIDPQGNERQVLANVAAFSVAYDSQNRLHIAAEDSDYASNTIYHLSCAGPCTRTTYTNSVLFHINPLHLEIVFSEDQALILTKAQKFVVLRSGGIYGMLMGDGVGSVFNVYLKEGLLKTCYQNPSNERYELTIDPVTMTWSRKRVPFRSNYQLPTNCLVTEFEAYSFIGYYNYQPYNNDLMIYSFKAGHELLERIGVEEIKLMKLHQEAILIGGLDEDTLDPVLYEYN